MDSNHVLLKVISVQTYCLQYYFWLMGKKGWLLTSNQNGWYPAYNHFRSFLWLNVFEFQIKFHSHAPNCLFYDRSALIKEVGLLCKEQAICHQTWKQLYSNKYTDVDNESNIFCNKQFLYIWITYLYTLPGPHSRRLIQTDPTVICQECVPYHWDYWAPFTNMV